MIQMPPHADEDFLDVSGILEPKSVAVIGASERSGNVGGDTVRRLLKFQFPGPVWPVNRSAADVAGLPSFSDVSQLPGVPDLAILAIPVDGLIDAIRDCAEVGIRHGIAYAGGLAEAGGEGTERQRALVALCREKGFTLCGPNCVGVINTSHPATLTFSTALYEMDELRPGVISMVGQSGGICTTVFSMAQEAGFGFRHMVSSGNEAVVTFADYLYAFARDENTRIIAGYLEGVPDGPKFVRALEEARRQGKPVVLIKSGTTGASARAAQAHTGTLVGEDRVFDAIFQEMGVIRVYSMKELIDVSLMLVANGDRLPAGPGVGVVTFGGGSGVLGADQCAQFGLTTPALSADCVERLRPLLVSVATAANPVDLTPTTAFRAEALAQLPQAMEVVAAEPQIDSVMLIAGSLASRATEICNIMRGLSSRSTKPVCISWPSPPKGVADELAVDGIYVFPEPAEGVRALQRLTRQGAAAARPARPVARNLAAFDWSPFVPDPRSDLVIPEHGCHQILRAAGLAVAAGELACDETEALRAAEAMEYPVALKAVSPKVTHRAAAGLLAVDLGSPEEVRDAFRRLTTRADEIAVKLDGIYVQKMHKGGTELLVSAFRDPVFGTMVSCGSGGGLTELIDDVVTERAPVGEALAAHMLDRLRIRCHASDAKGAFASDAAAAFIARFSELAETAPWSRFIFEVNPIKWTRDAVVAVDGLLIIEAI
jgi:acetate---CoA ligase (ADP-forming)